MSLAVALAFNYRLRSPTPWIRPLMRFGALLTHAVRVRALFYCPRSSRRALAAPTIWTGPTTSFCKPGVADPTRSPLGPR